MSPFIEFDGKNVEGAISKACETLNIPRDRLKHEVVCFGSTGIFGLVGFKKARIRVTAPASRTADPAETLSEIKVPADPFLMPDEIPADHQPGTASLFQSADTQRSQPALFEESAAMGSQALQQMVDAVTCGAEISMKCCSRHVVYTISCTNPAAVIGNKGQTLQAIQYLLNKIVNRSAAVRIRIIVEISGHTLKRQQELQAMAGRIAEKVCRNGKAVTVGRFNPQERKIIHLTLKNDRRVKTLSKGEGYVKKLVVIPREA